jgi:nucleoside-diphosphate-sugar epimerase
MAVWLVTGGSGFLGRHLLAALRSKPDVEVVALGRKCPNGWPFEAFVRADLERPTEIRSALRAIQPGVIVHTAGRTPPASSDELYRANTLAALHLLDAVRDESPAARVILTGSASELGPVAEDLLPVGEDHPCRPIDAYGLSKWLATTAALTMSFDLSIARIFNPIGPGQPASQALGKFADQLAAGASTIVVGDLEARRDFIDVRDVVEALIALAGQVRARQIYHVGTGRSHRVGDALEHLIKKSGRAVEVRIDPTLARVIGPRDSRADITRILTETDWRPRIEWEQSLDDLWHDAVSRGRPPS